MGDAIDWQDEIRKRSLWFHECHLRRINLQSMRGQDDDFWKNADRRKEWGLPEWTKQEIGQRNSFSTYITSEGGDWLGFRRPKKLFEKLNAVREAFVSRLGTTASLDEPVVPRYQDAMEETLFHAVSRIELCQEKPWLTLELFDPRITADEVIETALLFGGELQDPDHEVEGGPDPFLQVMRDAAASKARNRGAPGKLRWTYLDPDTKKFVVRADLPALSSPGGKLPAIIDNRYSARASRWMKAVDHEVRDAYLVVENSDMGLTHLVRLLYLYGTLPDGEMAQKLAWRRRALDAKKQQQFDAYVQTRIQPLRELLSGAAGRLGEKEQKKVQADLDTLLRDYARLRLALLLGEQNPASADFRFSLLVENAIRRVLHGYKFWIDEDFHARDHQNLVDARPPNDVKPEKALREQQFWSENHYIMFASAEYLIGQLWPGDDFLAGHDWRAPDQAKGSLKGEQRRRRGRWRALKYLNNRLTMGWTEFNASGYYREHMEALLNLADFAMDEEVQTKARMALDLMFFDLARHHHKGATGAAGGRSQFKSKHTGWGSAVGDVLEILWGDRGLFYDTNGDVPALFATSSYRPPDVLLEIGAHPPEKAYIDRARVSIDFAEAPKYGIGYSQDSDEKKSLISGYAAKLSKRSKHIRTVNEGIAETHSGYGQKEEDTIFWWTTSAFFNKQNLLGTLEAIKKWKLEDTDPFPLAENLFGSAFEPFDNLALGALGLAGGAVAGSIAGPPGAFAGAGYGAFKGFQAGGKVANARSLTAWAKVLLIAKSLLGGPIGVAASLLVLGDPFSRERQADDLSVFLEGSTRTRVNIYTYHSRDVMLSSVQNFRPGQLNFQSQVNQATLSAGVSVFTTTALEGIKFSLLQAGLAGSLLGAYGTIGAVAIDHFKLKADTPSSIDDEDGPSWWTGYWALPLVAQYGGAAILIYDGSFIQRQIADLASQVWFPEDGFDQVVDDVEPKNFDDTSWFGGDVTEAISDAVFGANGIWSFGRIVHDQDPEHPEEIEEAYIGVFSNNRLDKLNEDSDYYEREVEKKRDEYRTKVEDYAKARDDFERKSGVGKSGLSTIGEMLLRVGEDEASLKQFNAEVDRRAASEALFRDQKDAILALGKQDHELKSNPWRDDLVKDCFQGRSRHAAGSNIWILQVGSRAEFGSFESFQQRVRDAAIELDDTGDKSCSYDIPQPGGGSVKLAVDYEDRSFQVDGKDFAVDRYPRFENPFIRGGQVEWGQRVYAIEHGGKQLLHDLSDFTAPVRSEQLAFSDADADTIRALAIYVRTENEDMDLFTVGRASVSSRCQVAAQDEIIAVGKADEDTDHDVEWIFFDRSLPLSPDMFIEIEHPGKIGDAHPHWRMSFRLRALMGDLTWRDCRVDFAAGANRDASGEDEIYGGGGTRVTRTRFQLNFEDGKRKSGPIPFIVPMERWRGWLRVEGLAHAPAFTVARQPSGPPLHHEQAFLLRQEESGRVRLLSYQPCVVTETWKTLGRDPDLPPGMRLSALELSPGWLAAFAFAPRRLMAVWKAPGLDGPQVDWEEVSLQARVLTSLGTPAITAIGAIVALEAAPSMTMGIPAVDLYLTDAAGNLYTQAVDSGSTAGIWNTIPLPGGEDGPGLARSVCAAGSFVFLTDEKARLWAIDRATASLPLPFQPGWTRIGPGEGFRANPFARLRAVEMLGPEVRVFAISGVGEIWCSDYYGPSTPLEWKRLGGDRPPRFDPQSPFTAARSDLGRAHVFATGFDQRVWTATHDPAGEWAWTRIVPDSEFRPAADEPIFALCRTEGLLEVFALDARRSLWSGWWM